MNNYLLTYIVDGYHCYGWFESEDEMNDYMEERGDYIEVLGKLHILNAIELE